MLDLGHACLQKSCQEQARIENTIAYIRIRIVDQGIQEFHSLPDAHRNTLASFEIDSGLYVEGHRLFF